MRLKLHQHLSLQFILLSIIVLIKSTYAALSTYEDLFQPFEEEYDPWKFDPKSIYGTPLGGYGRATRSRIASLPIRLVGASNFDARDRGGIDIDIDIDTTAAAATTNIDDDGVITAIEGENGESTIGRGEGEDNISFDHDGFYFTTRDGQGRLYSCRIYNENELESDTLSTSLFDSAMERERGLFKLVREDDDDEEEKEEEEEELDSDKDEQKHKGNIVGNPNEQKISSEQSKDNIKDYESKNSNTKHTSDKFDISSRLERLNGYCAQLHKDWWSYEWCHDKSVSQFHLAMNMNGGETQTSASAAAAVAVALGYTAGPGLELATFSIESVTLLGKFSQREVLYNHDNNDIVQSKGSDGDVSSPPPLSKDSLSHTEELIQDVREDIDQKITGASIANTDQTNNDMHDHVKNGDNQAVESESDLTSPPPPSPPPSLPPLSAELSSSSSSTVSKLNEKQIIVNTIDDKDNEKSTADNDQNDDKRSIEIFETFTNGKYCEESKKQREIQVHLRCCEENKEINKLYSKAAKSKSQGGAIVVSFQNIEEDEVCHYKATICTNVLCKSFGLIQEIITEAVTVHHKEPIEIKKDDSIHEILDKALGSYCISRNEGWWTYRFCHKYNIYQYHEEAVIDSITGLQKTVVDTQITLGKYDTNTLDGFPTEEEINHMYLPKDRGFDTGNENENSNHSAETIDPYYVQEYLHGDICEGSDVVDSAIKGGKIGDGKIERSTTVRFFCGNQKAIMKVNEDSTCHYVMDISVPELCIHKYFEIPRIQTQVVKCLPVD